MTRKSDVDAIVAAAKAQHREVKAAYDRSLTDRTLDLRVPVKNLMENLRSALDYMAQDIYETCCQAALVAAGKREPRVYFPYVRLSSTSRRESPDRVASLVVAPVCGWPWLPLASLG